MITEHWDKVEDWDYSNVGKVIHFECFTYK
jgi:hypothetical protein